MSYGRKEFWQNRLLIAGFLAFVGVAIGAMAEIKWCYWFVIAVLVGLLVMVVFAIILEIVCATIYKYRLLGVVETKEEKDLFDWWWALYLHNGQVDIISIDAESPQEKALLEKILAVKIPKFFKFVA